MKHIFLFTLLLVYSVQPQLIFPSTFPILKDSERSIQDAQEAFSVACIHTWKILTARSLAFAAFFPVNLFALYNDPGFKISVKCSNNRKSMNVTFLAPSCEQMYEGLADNPIVFQIEQKRPNSTEVHFQLISSCIRESSTFLIDTANIGHYNDTIWYLVHRSIMDSAKNVRFAFIIFGQDRHFSYKNYVNGVRNALKHINETFFSSQLSDFTPSELTKMHKSCALSSCYPNQLTSIPFTKTTNDQDGKMKILIFLLILVIVGVFLLGVIIFYKI